MTKEEFIEAIKKIDGVSLSEEDMKLSFTNDIKKEDIESVLKSIIEYEKDNAAVNVYMKGLSTEVLANIFREAYKQEELRNPTILLNIINIVKSYNSLDDEFFSNPKICISSIEDFLDLKIELKNETNAFIRQFTIYFLSIIRSYGKTSHNVDDTVIENLPPLYDMIFESLDLASICAIFQKSEPVSTSECVYILNDIKYMSSVMFKSNMTQFLMNTFFKDKCEENK